MIRVYYADNAIVIDSIPTSFVAGTLSAKIGVDGTVRIVRTGDDFPFVSHPWSDIAGEAPSLPFGSPSELMAYLAAQLAMRRPVGTTTRSYAVDAVAGMTVFPISPEPTDINSVALIVNGTAYYQPDIGVSSLAVTWQGAFSLDSLDALRVTYV